MKYIDVFLSFGETRIERRIKVHDPSDYDAVADLCRVGGGGVVELCPPADLFMDGRIAGTIETTWVDGAAVCEIDDVRLDDETLLLAGGVQ